MLSWFIDTENNKLVFECGCKFDIVAMRGDKMPRISIDYENLPDCKGVWDMIGQGKVKGVFQLESQFGKQWAQDVKPESLEHMSALGAILRPGALQSVDDENISTTKHYSLRKNGLEPVPKVNPVVDEILKDTYGLNIYQEDSINLGMKIASFTAGEADTRIRKGLSKKDTAIIAKTEKQFLDGAAKAGIVSDELAKQLFSSIKAGQRYAFNKCISPSTIVETKDGEFKTIDELNIGDKITCPNGYAQVVNKYENGKKEVFEVTLESGKTIICTMDHEFLCEDNIKRKLSDILVTKHKIVTADD